MIKSSFDIGHYVNADDIEKTLLSKRSINISTFKIAPDSKDFTKFIENHSLTAKARSRGFDIQLKVSNNEISILPLNQQLSYESALIADYIRSMLIRQGKKITFETVMSHPSKVETLRMARKNGYKNYLYFICTSSPEINVERVDLRVKRGGHHVDTELIVKRYYNSLNLLKEAVTETFRTFVWDNSGRKPKLILEVTNGHDVTIKSTEIPLWVDEYLLSK